MPNPPESPTSPASELPAEVITCLKNARYLHLATSDGLWPHVSLMNYTYLPSTPYPLPSPQGTTAGPVIVMTMPPSTKKTCNLVSNPRVSLLVHDWVSHRTAGGTNALSSSPPGSSSAGQSSLATLLSNLNTAALSSISATLFGYAHVVPQHSEEEEYYKRVHTENNPGGENRCYLEGEDVKVVVVRIGWCRVADYKGGVKDWVAEGEEEERREFEGASAGVPVPGVPVVNGV